MTKSNTFFQTLKPGIPKRYLIFVAAVVWTFAGGILLYRGFLMLMLNHEMLWEKIVGSIIVGIIFFVYTFSNISLKHILRIVNLQQDRPCFFFFQLEKLFNDGYYDEFRYYPPYDRYSFAKISFHFLYCHGNAFISVCLSVLFLWHLLPKNS